MLGESLVASLKCIFARYGIFETMVCDNQFDCAAINNLASAYGVTIITSSPRFPSANSAAERSVQTFKNLMKKNTDPYVALLSYRCTPLADGLSPGEDVWEETQEQRSPSA